MKLEWRSLVSLKTPVIVGFIIAWNAGVLFANYSGGEGFWTFTPKSMKMAGFVCLGASLFSLAVAAVKPFQAVVIAPTRAKHFTPKDFFF